MHAALPESRSTAIRPASKERSAPFEPPDYAQGILVQGLAYNTSTKAQVIVVQKSSEQPAGAASFPLAVQD